jgi:hypothetical protein
MVPAIVPIFSEFGERKNNDYQELVEAKISVLLQYA